MRTESFKHSKSSWPKVIAKKWLNIKTGGTAEDQFRSDYYTINGMAERRKSCSDDNRYVVVPEELSETWLTEGKDDSKGLLSTSDNINLRMFVGTWNVGGKTPHDGLNLRDWLNSSGHADIYVLGFQEIVPLNAGNVLGAENKSHAAKWLSLIRKALNSNKTNPQLPNYYNTATDKQSGHFYHDQQQQQQQPTLKPRVSFSNLLSLEDELNHEDFERFYIMNSCEDDSPSNCNFNPIQKQNSYCLAASKQMVGLFLCVFVRSNLFGDVTNLKISCVGRGIMGYLGNKGSISISMTLYQTTFCFVCTHLASGEKEGDEFKRNSDVMEILKKTRFSHSFRVLGKPVPPNILDHDKIIWLGDLNYRLSSSCGDMHELLKKSDWQALLEKDQLRLEQSAGRIFKGWEEGHIYFAPTYKYLTNSDHYVVQTSSTPKEKRRTPAWCDRILWKGEGLKQISYVRGESKFSDHRPVYSLFSVQINLPPNKNKLAKPIDPNTPKSSPGLLPTCVAKVQAEELLLNRAKSCIQSTPRFSVTAKKLTNH